MCLGCGAEFNEEQLRLYKEYAAKEQAAIEERLKRKAVMVGGSCFMDSNGGMAVAWIVVPCLQACTLLGRNAAKELSVISGAAQAQGSHGGWHALVHWLF
jgi:hypothetical protein